MSLDGQGSLLYEVRASADAPSLRPLDTAGTVVTAPRAGESVWVVAVNPTATSTSAR